MRRRHYRRSQGEVELNLASMLDMAFQLLAFFIITFHPPEVESQIAMRLPPAQPPKISGKDNGKENAGDTNKATTEVKNVDTLLITLYSENGNLDGIMVGPDNMAKPLLPNLSTRLQKDFADENSPFEQVIIQCSQKLRYENLMQVVKKCSRQRHPDGTKLEKLSFVELPEANIK